VLPASTKNRLNHLFNEVEKEFEAIYIDNMQLREKIALMEKGTIYSK
jgi:Asp-tRNA(Asn)/Glu-tRNA(Gln) amidotransferase B subunit